MSLKHVIFFITQFVYTYQHILYNIAQLLNLFHLLNYYIIKFNEEITN